MAVVYPAVLICHTRSMTSELIFLSKQTVAICAKESFFFVVHSFADGRLTHTNRFYFHSARPQYASQSFTLLSTFPNKELSDSEQSVEAAGIANAAILLRLKWKINTSISTYSRSGTKLPANRYPYIFFTGAHRHHCNFFGGANFCSFFTHHSVMEIVGIHNVFLCDLTIIKQNYKL